MHLNAFFSEANPSAVPAWRAQREVRSSISPTTNVIWLSSRSAYCLKPRSIQAVRQPSAQRVIDVSDKFQARDLPCFVSIPIARYGGQPSEASFRRSVPAVPRNKGHDIKFAFSLGLCSSSLKHPTSNKMALWFRLVRSRTCS